MTSAAASMLPLGARIAERYVVCGRVGRGGMGEVYEVEHTLLGRRFALKRMSGGATDRRLIERFLREARAAAATGHAGIVEVFDLGFTDDGMPFLVMELLRGETLRDRLRRGRLDEDELVHVARSVLAALDAVHRRSIIHRDIKPENLYLCAGDGERPRVKILDFGLAQLQVADGAEFRLTQSGAVMGTPLYMSPEQARGIDVDHRTDLYALGAVLYECASGEPPFRAETYSALVLRVVEQTPDAAPLAVVSERVREGILRALAKQPGERFADAATMRSAVCGDPAPSPAAALEAPRGPRASSSKPTLTAPLATATAETLAETPIIPQAPSQTPTPALAATETPMPASSSSTARSEPAGRGRLRWTAGAVALGLAAVATVAIALWPRGGERGEPAPRPGVPAAAPPAASSEIPDTTRAMETGDVEGVVETLRRAALRRPDDLVLRGRELLVALTEDRRRAYAVADELRARELPAVTAEAVQATLAVERGDPAAGAAVLAPLAQASPGDLALVYCHAVLLRLADDVVAAQAALRAILERWPAFTPAVEALVQYLLFQGDAESARGIVDRYAAVAPEGPDVAMVEIEMLIGERRYTDALNNVEKLLAASPGLEHELYQFEGDLLILLGDPEAAIAAYDSIDDLDKRSNYVSGALLERGRVAEARALMLSTIEGFPPNQGKLSRLAKVAIDATLLALETEDVELVTRTAAALGGREGANMELSARSALAFARATQALLAGGAGAAAIDASGFPLGARSGLHALLQARIVPPAEALVLLREATAPQGMTFSAVPTHVYPALWVARAEAALAEKLYDEALAAADTVLRPRHYDSARGVVVRRAMSVRMKTLDALGRTGEARAVERELKARFEE